MATGTKVWIGVGLTFAVIGIVTVVKLTLAKKQPPTIITKTPPNEAPAQKEPAQEPVIVAEGANAEPEVKPEPKKADKPKSARESKEKAKAV